MLAMPLLWDFPPVCAWGSSKALNCLMTGSSILSFVKRASGLVAKLNYNNTPSTLQEKLVLWYWRLILQPSSLKTLGSLSCSSLISSLKINKDDASWNFKWGKSAYILISFHDCLPMRALEVLPLQLLEHHIYSRFSSCIKLSWIKPWFLNSTFFLYSGLVKYCNKINQPRSSGICGSSDMRSLCFSLFYTKELHL